MSQNGKGSTARPLSVPIEVFGENWDRAFRKKKHVLSIQECLDIAKRYNIEREEVYDPDSPSHWPKDRCYRLENDREFAVRIREMDLK